MDVAVKMKTCACMVCLYAAFGHMHMTVYVGEGCWMGWGVVGEFHASHCDCNMHSVDNE